MSFGVARARTQTRYFTALEAAATYLDDHVFRHYGHTFVGAVARIAEKELVLVAREGPDSRADARRWLEVFGPTFCGFPLVLDNGPEPPP